MKFKISRSIFFKSLSHLQGIVDKKNSLPILANILIEAKNNQLILSSTDMDISIIREKWGDEIVIIAGGGITDKNDIKNYLSRGANHISLGTICFKPWKIKNLEKKGLDTAIRKAHKKKINIPTFILFVNWFIIYLFET